MTVYIWNRWTRRAKVLFELSLDICTSLATLLTDLSVVLIVAFIDLQRGPLSHVNLQVVVFIIPDMILQDFMDIPDNPMQTFWIQMRPHKSRASSRSNY